VCEKKTLNEDAAVPSLSGSFFLSSHPTPTSRIFWKFIFGPSLSGIFSHFPDFPEVYFWGCLGQHAKVSFFTPCHFLQFRKFRKFHFFKTLIPQENLWKKATQGANTPKPLSRCSLFYVFYATTFWKFRNQEMRGRG